MNYPVNLLYSKSHEWVAFTGENTAKIGLTDFAQKALGGIVFINLPEKGEVLAADSVFGDIESVKAVSDLISPLNGTVTAINEELLDKPGKINDAPYEAWLVELTDISGREALLDAAAYEAFCKEAE